MRGYRRAWQIWWLVLALAGTVASGLLWPGPIVLLTWLFGGTVGLGIITAVRARDDDPHPFERVTARDLTLGVIVGALAMSGIIGWLGISGGGGMALVACAGLSSPPCVGRVRRLLSRGDVVEAPPLAGVTAIERSLGVAADDEASLVRATQLMSTAQLCTAWQQTFTHVERPHAADQQLRVLRLREAFLDELARRDPDGLDAWMCSTVPVEAAPTLFFGGHPPDISS